MSEVVSTLRRRAVIAAAMSAVLVASLLVAPLAYAAPPTQAAMEERADDGVEGPVTVAVDARKVRPRAADLPGIDGKTTRPVASLMDADGVQTDFVANEVILGTDDAQVLKSFLDRWGGAVVGKLETKGWTTQYLVRIDTRRADPSKLSDHLAALNVGKRKAESLAISSQAGLELLSAAAAEANGKLSVGVNWLTEHRDFASSSTFEAGFGPTGFNDDPNSAYVRDAYRWSYLNSGSVQDIGVTSGWTLLDSIDRLDATVRVGIVDAGFRPQVGNDLPQWTAYSPFFWADPLDPGPSGRPWHGTDSASAAAAVPDNFVGAAGPAGPIARLALVYTTPDYFLSMNAISLALQAGSQVINMSFGARVPWPLAWTVLPFDGYTAFIRAFNDILLFAAAGNDGESVDKTTCFFVCWEKHWHTPCENSGVLCVGGLRINSLDRDPASNWGSEDVDIFAPFSVLVGADPAFPDTSAVHLATGTSVASPYAAGVAALIWAANPGLSADSVQTILLRNMHTSPDPKVTDRVIHAFGAIRDALPAVISIQAPNDGATLSAVLGTEFRATVFDDDHGTPAITWTHNGIAFGTGSQVLALLPPGPQIVRATANFPDGASATDVIHVTVVNHPPTVHINAPRNPDNSAPSFGQNELIHFHATSLDDAGPLPNSQLSWHLDGASASFATGHDPIVNTGAAPGLHTVTLRGCDTFNVCASDSVPIMIQPGGANQPPSVQITTPANGAVLWVNGNDANGFYHELTLDGVVSDPEGGPLSVVWLDNGTQIATSLTPTVRLRGVCENYPHRLTLRVTDNAGNTRQDEVDVTVAILC